ncbi:MAG: GDSL-type esterase/lipase family protein [Tepidisphaerales bacterium]
MWPYSQPALGWGIYLDAQTGNYTVENNLVYNTLSGGLMFNNGGHEHVIRNNIFALSANQALWPYSEKRPSSFRRNIVYLTQGSLLIPHGEASLNQRLAAKESPGDWDENIYWHTAGPDALRFYRRTFADWQAIGLDRHSRIADPQFVNPAAADFTLKPTSPALELGFQPLDISKAGLYGDDAWTAEVRHANCPHVQLPPPPAPPKPLAIDDDFEKTPVGAHPANAHVSGEREGASIRVTDERAASGRHSLKITDSKTLQPAWEPHFYYEPHMTAGAVRQSFDVWFPADAQFFCEWRDSAEYPKNVGPSVRFDGTGKVSVAGKVVAEVPARTWVHVQIDAALGKTAPRTFKLALTPTGAAPRVFDNLPITGADFHELHWLGFSSTAVADTAYYLDNLAISGSQALAQAPPTAANTAVIPVPKLENDSYDWYARHAAVLEVQQRLNPEIVLIGDSITHFWAGEPVAGNRNGPNAWKTAFGDRQVLNMGFGWDRTQNVLWRLDHGEFDGLHPRFIVINIGTNNLTGTRNARENTPAEIAEAVALICDRLAAKSPASKITIMGVFPRGEKADNPLRPKIRRLNELLAELAKKKGAAFLDIGSKLVQEDGTISRQIMGDFCHPTEQGYAIWAEALQPVLKN